MDAQQARSLHEDRLMKLANVTGVGIGKDELPQALNSVRAGEAPVGADVIIVFVTRTVPRDRLRDEDVIPDLLEGVPVRVLAIGETTAQ